jgi:hypothetical protein
VQVTKDNAPAEPEIIDRMATLLALPRDERWQ